MLTTPGRRVLAQAMLGTSVRYALGAGAGTDPVTPDDTRLAGDGDPATAWYVPLDAGFPLHQDDGSIVVQATFPRDSALFTWTEWGLVASSSPLRAGHSILDLGTEQPAVLVARQLPSAALHSEPKDTSRSWVLRAIVSLE